jgi:ribonuclease HII
MPDKNIIIGIDEVGRGALAGPVTVAAALLPKKLRLKNYAPGKLRDSKKLSAKQRERWFVYFKDHPKINYAVARVYPRAIERLNISKAANLAAERAFTRLVKSEKLKVKSCGVFLDGGLFLGNGLEPGNAKTVIKGDEKIKAVTVASIIAKVTRDRAMVRLAKTYPQYGFEVHKGYGTKKHLAAIRKYGPSEVHRLTFLPRRYSI